MEYVEYDESVRRAYPEDPERAVRAPSQAAALAPGARDSAPASAVSNDSRNNEDDKDQGILGTLTSILVGGVTELLTDLSPHHHHTAAATPPTTAFSIQLRNSSARRSLSLIPHSPEVTAYLRGQRSHGNSVDAAAVAAASGGAAAAGRTVFATDTRHRGGAGGAAMSASWSYGAGGDVAPANSLVGSPTASSSGLLGAMFSGISTLGQRATDLLTQLDHDFETMFSGGLEEQGSAGGGPASAAAAAISTGDLLDGNTGGPRRSSAGEGRSVSARTHPLHHHHHQQQQQHHQQQSYAAHHVGHHHQQQQHHLPSGAGVRPHPQQAALGAAARPVAPQRGASASGIRSVPAGAPGGGTHAPCAKEIGAAAARRLSGSYALLHGHAAAPSSSSYVTPPSAALARAAARGTGSAAAAKGQTRWTGAKPRSSFTGSQGRGNGSEDDDDDWGWGACDEDHVGSAGGSGSHRSTGGRTNVSGSAAAGTSTTTGPPSQQRPAGFVSRLPHYSGAKQPPAAPVAAAAAIRGTAAGPNAASASSSIPLAAAAALSAGAGMKPRSSGGKLFIIKPVAGVRRASAAAGSGLPSAPSAAATPSGAAPSVAATPSGPIPPAAAAPAPPSAPTGANPATPLEQSAASVATARGAEEAAESPTLALPTLLFQTTPSRPEADGGISCRSIGGGCTDSASGTRPSSSYSQTGTSRTVATGCPTPAAPRQQQRWQQRQQPEPARVQRLELDVSSAESQPLQQQQQQQQQQQLREEQLKELLQKRDEQLQQWQQRREQQQRKREEKLQEQRQKREEQLLQQQREQEQQLLQLQEQQLQQRQQREEQLQQQLKVQQQKREQELQQLQQLQQPQWMRDLEHLRLQLEAARSGNAMPDGTTGAAQPSDASSSAQPASAFAEAAASVASAAAAAAAAQAAEVEALRAQLSEAQAGREELRRQLEATAGEAVRLGAVVEALEGELLAGRERCVELEQENARLRLLAGEAAAAAPAASPARSPLQPTPSAAATPVCRGRTPPRASPHPPTATTPATAAAFRSPSPSPALAFNSPLAAAAAAASGGRHSRRGSFGSGMGRLSRRASFSGGGGGVIADELVEAALVAQLTAALADKARLSRENDELQRQLEGLQELLAYTAQHSLVPGAVEGCEEGEGLEYVYEYGYGYDEMEDDEEYEACYWRTGTTPPRGAAAPAEELEQDQEEGAAEGAGMYDNFAVDVSLAGGIPTGRSFPGCLEELYGDPACDGTEGSSDSGAASSPEAIAGVGATGVSHVSLRGADDCASPVGTAAAAAAAVGSPVLELPTLACELTREFSLDFSIAAMTTEPPLSPAAGASSPAAPRLESAVRQLLLAGDEGIDPVAGTSTQQLQQEAGGAEELLRLPSLAPPLSLEGCQEEWEVLSDAGDLEQPCDSDITATIASPPSAALAEAWFGSTAGELTGGVECVHGGGPEASALASAVAGKAAVTPCAGAGLAAGSCGDKGGAGGPAARLSPRVMKERTNIPSSPAHGVL
ncbi:hypothetical protein Agub_g5367 [Astrephomene gubernaculifera]|uniref:Uncharacterized protein n=1 Tax=Astrephomene gubernaculifera TaxID=47775 RepID=A0AAD3HKP3_9CHLO|nr:hypothetical protein Agub_g5367 [Astrephomene gubernaculifera]